LRTLVASSTTFQAWVDEASAEAAKAHIYLLAIDASSISRPFAGVEIVPQSWRTQSVASGSSQDVYIDGGIARITFEDSAGVNDWTTEYYEFANRYEAVLADILALSGHGNHPAIANATIEDGPARVTDDDAPGDQDYYGVSLTVEFGLNV
jgi:hypothetical protein